MERDDTIIYICDFGENFNSHAHVERDNLDADDSIERIDFNSHAHVERDNETIKVNSPYNKFQLTRSRGA